MFGLKILKKMHREHHPGETHEGSGAIDSQRVEFYVFCAMMATVISFVVLGLFFHHLKVEQATESAPTRRIQDLVSLLNQAEGKRQTLETEMTQLRQKLVELEKGSPTDGKINDGSKDPELQRLSRLAGLVPMTGQGIIITMSDSKKVQSSSDDAHMDPNLGKLQAEDILKLVNELKAAGAKAVSINDQRLVVTSEIVAAGPTISVNQTRLSQPVVVRAIGEPDTLLGALKIRGGILEYLQFFEINVSIESKKNVTVPAYKGPLLNQQIN